MDPARANLPSTRQTLLCIVMWTGGILDVDMNAGRGQTREAVENVVWSTKMPDGPYKIVVNNFAQRETSNPGFVGETE